MRLLAPLLACSTILTLDAQDMKPLLQALWTTRQGSLVAVGPSEFTSSLQALIQLDPAVDLQVPLRKLPLDKGPGAALATREGWGATPHWAWLARDGRTLLQDTRVPTAIELAERLLRAGWVDRDAELQAILRKQPDHAEALEALFRHRLAAAKVRMAPFIKSADPAQPLALPELTRPLTETEDARIWGPVADALDRYLATGAWGFYAIQGGSSFLGDIPLAARHSPRIRSLASRHLSSLEGAVRRAPTSYAPMVAWNLCATLSGEGSITKLVQQLQGSPAHPFSLSAALGSEAVKNYARTCQATGNWEALEALLGEQVERTSPMIARSLQNTTSGRVVMDLEIRLLLEAHLKRGNERAADLLVRDLHAQGIPQGVALAVQVAMTCNRNDLAVTWGGLDPAPAPHPRRLLPVNCLLVLDDAEGIWSQHFKALMKLETLGELELKLEVQGGVAADELSALLGRPGPRWIYLDEHGRPQAEGRQLPTAAELTASLARVGITSMHTRLKAFCAANPDHLEAQWQLLRREFVRAARGMAPHLKPLFPGQDKQHVSVGHGASWTVDAPRECLTPLTAAEDQALWSDAARRMEALLKDPRWILGTLGFEPPLLAAHSPRMQTAARRCLPEVEAALRRYPSHGRLWAIREALAALAGGASVMAFVETLMPLPGSSPLPPEWAIRGLVQEARVAKRWAYLRTTLEALRQRGWDGGEDDDREEPDSFKGTWDVLIGPLVEAHLRLGDPTQADAVVHQTLMRFRPPFLPAAAAQIALASGHRDLALRWSALKVLR